MAGRPERWMSFFVRIPIRPYSHLSESSLLQALSQCVGNNGLIVLYGGMSGSMESTFMHWEVALRKLKITGYWVTPDIAAMTPQEKQERANEVRLNLKTL